MLHVNAATLRGLTSPCTHILIENYHYLGVLFNRCMQQKVHLLNVNKIGKDMGEEIYSNTLFNTL